MLLGDNGFMSINGASFQLYPMTDASQSSAGNPNPLRVRLGQRVWLRIFNMNPDSHAMHLHGHTFQVLRTERCPCLTACGQVIEMDGVPVAQGAQRDTVLVP